MPPAEDESIIEEKAAMIEQRDRAYKNQQTQIDRALDAVMKMKHQIETIKREHHFLQQKK